MTPDDCTANASTMSTTSADNETATAFQTTNVTLAAIGLGDLLPDQTTLQIWIPYVVLTIFLLLLVAVSFIRFHRGRVVQNKQRMEAIADTMEKDRQMTLLLDARDSEEADDGDYLGMHRAALDYSRPMSTVTSPGSPYVPSYLDAFLSFSQPSSVRSVRSLHVNMSLLCIIQARTYWFCSFSTLTPLVGSFVL